MMSEIYQMDSNSRFNNFSATPPLLGLELLNLTPTEIEMSDMANQICQENLLNLGVTTEHQNFSIPHSGLKMGK